MATLRSRPSIGTLWKGLLRNAPAKIVSLGVAVVVFYFVRTTSLEERFVTVPLELRISSRYTVTAGLPRSATVTLRGEGGAIFQISPDDIVAYVDLSGNRNEGVYRVPVLYEKKGDAAVLDPLEVTVEPAEVTATVEQVISRTLRVLPVISGGPPEGYELAGYSADPSSVQVSGPRRIVQGLQAMQTVAVDLSDTRESSILSVKLDYDARLLRLPGGSQVQLAVRIVAHGGTEEQAESPVNRVGSELSAD
jgi:YbbR domain-containing protein